MPNWVFLLVRFVLSASGCAFMTWAAWRIGQRDLSWALMAFVFSTPLVGVAIARPLVELSHEGLTWLSRQPHEKWQGRYYAFNDVQVRVFDDGERLWFCTIDLVKACHLKAVAQVLPGVVEVEGLPCLDLAGVEALQASNSNVELGKCLLWARREVVAPWERKKSGALIPR
ncbi:MAG TPA: hypothetical protein VLT89_08825 [Usitatibacter sp.]|nr:hypothetical protein [Usitatibacter sp.]